MDGEGLPNGGEAHGSRGAAMKAALEADVLDPGDALALDTLRGLMEHPEALGRAAGFEALGPLHGEWIREMAFGEGDYTLLAHRAAFKSSCLAVAIALRLVVFPLENLIFLRKTDDDVAEMLGMVGKLLRTRAMRDVAEALYGAPHEVLGQTAGKLSTSLWTSPMGAPQLLGLGIKSSITGKHAQVVITDDICNLSDRISAAERERTRLQYQELQNVRNRGGRIINLGTRWHGEDVFELMPNRHVYDCYHTGLIPPEKLAALRRSMSPALFACNYELKIIADADALFPEPAAFGGAPEDLRDGIAHVDAAYGGGDATALTCARRRGDVIYAYGRLWQAHVDRCLPEILRQTGRLMCAPIYCETNGDKGYLARELRRRGAAVRCYHESMNKYAKIATHLRKWWPRIVWLEGTDPEYIDQIAGYGPEAAHDDAPDSAAMVCRILGA